MKKQLNPLQSLIDEKTEILYWQEYPVIPKELLE